MLSNTSLDFLCALLILGFGVVAMVLGGPILPITVLVVVATLAVMAGDVARVEIAKIATLTFNRRRKRPPPGLGPG